MFSGGLVTEFSELPDQLFKDGSHLLVADDIRMQVNARELLGDQVQQGYSQSLERVLKNVQTKAQSKVARNSATGRLAELDQIRATGMSDYLGKTVAQ